MVDASVAVKWVVDEDGSDAAWRLREGHTLLAPELLAIECTNILWKKARLGELTAEEASLACSVLAAAPIELRPMRFLTEGALSLGLQLGHPAYDCIYLVLALEERIPFATADRRLVQRVRECPRGIAVPEMVLLTG